MTTSRSICPDTSAGRPARPLQPPDDRDLGPAAGGEYRRETGVCDQGQRAFGQRLPFLLAPAIGIAGQIGQRGLAAALGGDIGQRLQQPVHQRAALQGAGALRRAIRRSVPCGCRPRRGRMAAAELSAEISGCAGVSSQLGSTIGGGCGWRSGGQRPTARSPPRAYSASPGRWRSRSPEAARRNRRAPW